MKIYFPHPHGEANAHASVLINDIENFSDVRVITPDFCSNTNQVKTRKNLYEDRMAHVHEADLMVIILDHLTPENFLEIRERCAHHKPLLCFFRRGLHVHVIVRDCIHSYRRPYESGKLKSDARAVYDLPDPIEYQVEENGHLYDQIASIVVSWILDHKATVPDYFFRIKPLPTAIMANGQ